MSNNNLKKENEVLENKLADYERRMLSKESLQENVRALVKMRSRILFLEAARTTLGNDLGLGEGWTGPHELGVLVSLFSSLWRNWICL